MSDNVTQLLQQLKAGQITSEECEAQLRATQAPPSQVHYKASKKGCVSFYGIRNKFPITLYKDELEAMLDCILNRTDGQIPYNDGFKKFLEDNKDVLSTKK